jgi:hypothetical protein
MRRISSPAIVTYITVGSPTRDILAMRATDSAYELSLLSKKLRIQVPGEWRQKCFLIFQKLLHNIFEIHLNIHILHFFLLIFTLVVLDSLSPYPILRYHAIDVLLGWHPKLYQRSRRNQSSRPAHHHHQHLQFSTQEVEQLLHPTCWLLFDKRRLHQWQARGSRTIRVTAEISRREPREHAFMKDRWEKL